MMDQNEKNYVMQKAKELMGAYSCCAEAKEATQAWLDAIGTEKEKEAAQNLIAELEEDLMPIEGVIAFAGSEAGAQFFGAERAKELEAHAREVQAAGGKYCDCPACVAAAAILEKKDLLLEGN